MAGRDVFNFDITANSQQAKQAFEELKQLSDELENISMDVKADPKSSKNLTELVVKMTEVIRTHNELSKTLSEEHTVSFHANNKELAKEIAQSIKMVDDATKRINRSAENAMNVRQMKTGKKFRWLDNVDDYTNGPSASQKEVTRTKEFSKKLQRELNQGLSLGRNAMNTGYINANQASNYRQIHGDLLGPKYQGGTREEVLSEGFKPEKGSKRYESQQKIEQARELITEKKADIEQVYSDTSISNEETRLKIAKQIEKEMRDQVSILNEHQKIIQTLDSAVEQLGAQADELNLKNAQGTAPREKADRSSMWGRMYERASSIALASVGAATYAMTSQYKSGKDITKGLREDSLNIGYQTGNYDFRGIRQDNMAAGAPTGWKGTDMLGFTESVLSKAGYQDDDQLTSMVQNLADASKFMGVGKEGTTQFMEGLYQSGGVSTAEQAKAIQDGFLGAIKASGMEGREKEQLDALGAINENLFSGREATNEEVEARMAMMGVLSSTNNRGLQGENLANFMTSADDTIKNSDPTSTLGLLMGVGRDPRYMGENWQYNYEVDTEKGLNAENFNKIAGGLKQAGGGNTEAVSALIKKELAPGTSVEAIKDLLDMYPEGIPEGAEGEKLLKEYQEKGALATEENKEAYMESDDQSAQSAEAWAEKRNSLLNDNALIGALDELRESINGLSATNAFTAIGSSLITGVVSGVTTALGSVVWSSLSQGISGVASTGLSATAGGAGGGLFARAGQLFTGPTSLASKAKGMFGGGGGATSAATTAGEAVAGTATATGATEVMASQLGKTKGIAGKAMPVLATALAGYNILSSDNKAKATGKEAGVAVGGLGGMKLGAMIGTAIAPGIGTAIGGALGGLGGLMLGGKAGSWIGEKAGGAWDWATGKNNKVDAAELTDEEREELKDKATPSGKNTTAKNENTATQSEEKALATSKQMAEKLRQSNISTESQNLSFFESLLAQISDLLDRAKAQNGIIGLMDGLETGGGSTGPGGSLDYTGNGDYWTNSDIRQHDLAKTSNALTAEDLDEWINSNTSKDSLMRGMGATFMEAGNQSGLDPRYLVAHAAHETGWGTSSIVKNKNNMFGIGAFDASPGSSAYSFSDPKEGIIGGAKWIAENYYKEGQTTLDSMRNNGGNHEYATDPNWDEKIAAIMKGSEKYTSPSNVSVQTTVNYTGSGDPEKDGRALASTISSKISDRFTTEHARA